MNFGFSENNITVTTTDMHPEDLANPEKLVNETQRVYYDKNEYRNYNTNNNNYNDSDDEINDVDDDAINYKKNANDKTESYHNFNKNNMNKNENNEEDEEEDENDNDNETENDNINNKNTHKKVNDPDDPSSWTKEEMMLKKLDLLRKLGELHQAGVVLSDNYSLNSSYDKMKFEYDLHSNIRSKQNSLNWMSNMMIGIVKGIELLNDNMNPFDMKFDGMWSNEVKSDITNYYDVLGEIYEKYTTPGKKMAPELKLFLMLTGSAVSIQMHKGIANYMAGKSDVSGELDDNPDKIRELRRQNEEKNNEQKRKMKEKEEEERKNAFEKMEKFNMLKKQEMEYNEIKNSKKNYAKLQNDLIMSESAKSQQKNKKSNSEKQMEQMEKIEKQMQQQMQQQIQQSKMNNEMKMLAEMNRALSAKKKEKEIIAKNVSSSDTNNSDDDIDDDEVSRIESKYDNKSQKSRNSDTNSVASSAILIKNPDLKKLIGKKKKDNSSVTQIEVVDRSSAVESSARKR
jgi:hypothetical protein